MIEYHQMTIDEWSQIKESLRQELNGVVSSFVSIGYKLKQIRDEELYRNDGYDTLAEFAQEEYGMGESTISRFMAINDKYSIDGNSPQLLEQYRDYGSSRLTEMLTLPVEAHAYIKPDTKVKDIREFKKFKKEEEQQTSIDTLDLSIATFNMLHRSGVETVEQLKTMSDAQIAAVRNLGRKGYEEILTKLGRDAKRVPIEETELEEDQQKEEQPPEQKKELNATHKSVVKYFEDKKLMLDVLFDGEVRDESQLEQLINPSGNATFKHGLQFWFLYKNGEGLLIKQMLHQPRKMTYTELFDTAKEIYADYVTAGESTHEHYYGLATSQETTKRSAEKEEKKEHEHEQVSGTGKIKKSNESNSGADGEHKKDTESSEKENVECAVEQQQVEREADAVEETEGIVENDKEGAERTEKSNEIAESNLTPQQRHKEAMGEVSNAMFLFRKCLEHKNTLDARKHLGKLEELTNQIEHLPDWDDSDE